MYGSPPLAACCIYVHKYVVSFLFSIAVQWLVSDLKNCISISVVNWPYYTHTFMHVYSNPWCEYSWVSASNTHKLSLPIRHIYMCTYLYKFYFSTVFSSYSNYFCKTSFHWVFFFLEVHEYYCNSFVQQFGVMELIKRSYQLVFDNNMLFIHFFVLLHIFIEFLICSRICNFIHAYIFTLYCLHECMYVCMYLVHMEAFTDFLWMKWLCRFFNEWNSKEAVFHINIPVGVCCNSNRTLFIITLFFCRNCSLAA